MKFSSLFYDFSPPSSLIAFSAFSPSPDVLTSVLSVSFTSLLHPSSVFGVLAFFPAVPQAFSNAFVSFFLAASQKTGACAIPVSGPPSHQNRFDHNFSMLRLAFCLLNLLILSARDLIQFVLTLPLSPFNGSPAAAPVGSQSPTFFLPLVPRRSRTRSQTFVSVAFLVPLLPNWLFPPGCPSSTRPPLFPLFCA